MPKDPASPIEPLCWFPLSMLVTTCLCKQDLAPLTLLLLCAFVLLGLLGLMRLRSPWPKVTMILGGASIALLNLWVHPVNPPHMFSARQLEATHWRVQITEPLKPYPEGWSAQAIVKPSGARVRFFLKKKHLEGGPPPLPYDTVTLQASLRPQKPTVEGAIFQPPATPSLQVKALLGHEPPSSSRPDVVVSRALATIRLGILQKLDRHLEPLDAALIKGLILGQKGELPLEFRAPLDMTGTGHLLAVSGLHLGALMAILWSLFSPIAARTRWAQRRGLHRVLVWPVGFVMGAYVVLVGAPVSARRAFGMGMMMAGAHVQMRRIQGSVGLGLVVVGMLLWDPGVVEGAGFWLSVGATCGIVLSVECGQHQQEERVPNWKLGLRASFGAFLGTLPVGLALRWEVPVAGMALNLLFIPCVTCLIFPGTVLGLGLLWVWPEAATLVLGSSADGLICLREIAQWVVGHQLALWCPGQKSVGVLVGLGACVLVGLGSTQIWRKCACVVLGLGLLLGPWDGMPDTRPGVTVDFIPVGQGDATLVTFRDGSTLLVDAGGVRQGRDPGLHQVLGHLRKRGVRRLDWALVSHADLDHMRGFHALNQYATPHTLFYDPRQDFGPLLAHAKKSQVILHPVKENITFEHQGTQVQILLPPTHKSKNEMSLVVLISHAKRTVVLPGDLEADGESWLKEQLHVGQRVDVFKAAHHGSKTSSSRAITKAADPQVVVISCGFNNRFGHPHREVMRRWHAQGADVLRTDLHGLVRLHLSDQGDMNVFAGVPPEKRIRKR